MKQTTKTKHVDAGPGKARSWALLLGSTAGAALLAASPALAQTTPVWTTTSPHTPIVLTDQGSFAVGGTFVTNAGTFDPIATLPDGQTIHGDHAYVQYQIPQGAHKFPIVMWHGGGQFSKTWETTPDGRDGFQNIFVRRNFSTYILDQPHRGRSGRSTTNGTITAIPGPGATGEQGISSASASASGRTTSPTRSSRTTVKR